MNELVVLHQGAIGDFVLTLSVIQPLRALLRAEHVTVVAGAASARLAAGRSAVDMLISPDAIGLHSLFREDGDLSPPLQELLTRAGCVLSFLSGPRDAMHTRLAQRCAGPVISVNPRPSETTVAGRKHITAQWTDAIRAQGHPIGDAAPPAIRLPGNTVSAAQPRGKILIHPGAGATGKCWPAEQFAALAARLARTTIEWMLGPAELEREPSRFAAVRRRASAHHETLHVEEDLTRAAEQMASADRYLGNDAGPTHVAAALGIPTVVLFGPTDPCLWRPLGSHVTVIAPPRPADIADLCVEDVYRALA